MLKPAYSSCRRIYSDVYHPCNTHPNMHPEHQALSLPHTQVQATKHSYNLTLYLCTDQPLTRLAYYALQRIAAPAPRKAYSDICTPLCSPARPSTAASRSSTRMHRAYANALGDAPREPQTQRAWLILVRNLSSHLAVPTAHLELDPRTQNTQHALRVAPNSCFCSIFALLSSPLPAFLAHPAP